MANIDQLIAKAQKLRFEPILEASIEETREQLKDIQREQLLHGQGKFGMIGKYRSGAYAAKKFALNNKAGFGNVDLKLTGSFHNEIFVDVRTNSVVTDSADEKAGDLIDKYGEQVFGLNKENRANYSKHIMGPVAVRKIKGQIL